MDDPLLSAQVGSTDTLSVLSDMLKNLLAQYQAGREMPSQQSCDASVPAEAGSVGPEGSREQEAVSSVLCQGVHLLTAMR